MQDEVIPGTPLTPPAADPPADPPPLPSAESTTVTAPPAEPPAPSPVEALPAVIAPPEPPPIDEKTQKAIDVVMAAGYSLPAALGIVKQYGADVILAPPSPCERTQVNFVQPSASTNQTHAPECGDVGVTGEHGDLGSNAAKSSG
jgi:hypothetical protein